LRETLGLRLLAVLELDLVELGDPVDDFRDVLAEALGDLLLRGRRVLDDIVEDRRDQRVGVQVQLGENQRGGDRVCDVRLAAQAFLPQVGRSAEFSGGTHPFHLLGGQVAGNLGQ